MRVRLVLAVAVLVTAAGGCGETPGGRLSAASAPPVAAAPASAPSPTIAPSMSSTYLTSTVWRLPTPSVKSSAGTNPGRTETGRPTRISSGWEITVYYTAVERFHDGDPTGVTGCPRLNCSNGDDDLGSYPSDFVEAVRDEGTGRTASGKYLNWSYDVGFWLDSVPRTSDAEALVPFVSAAADPSVLPHGTRFAIAACGHQDDGSAPAAAICAVLRKARWRITDEFTPGLGGPRHIDAYIGPETGPGFTDSDWYLTLTGAELAIG